METYDLTEAGIVGRLRAAGCVFAEEEAHLLMAAARTPAELTAMVERRVAGFPLEPIIGWAEFGGLRIAVDPGVFVPRQRTAFLLSKATELIAPGSVAVDLCCGSGAIGAALAAACGGRLELHAVDIDPVAVSCARRNIAGFGGRVYEGDLYASLPAGLRGRVHMIVANAPYVPSDAIRLLPPEARVHEPHIALDGGADGLDIQRRVVASAAQWLAPGGYLLVETSRQQATQTAELFTHGGLIPKTAYSDELDATVVIGRS